MLERASKESNRASLDAFANRVSTEGSDTSASSRVPISMPEPARLSHSLDQLQRAAQKVALPLSALLLLLQQTFSIHLMQAVIHAKAGHGFTNFLRLDACMCTPPAWTAMQTYMQHSMPAHCARFQADSVSLRLSTANACILFT